jgi:hypothetical protein
MEERVRLDLHEVRVGPRSRVAVNSATRGQHTHPTTSTSAIQDLLSLYREPHNQRLHSTDFHMLLSQYIADLLLPNLKLMSLSP